MGYDGRHALRTEDYSEAEKFELAGNAISTATSEKLAIAAKAYYSPTWHAEHVRKLWQKEGRTFDTLSSPPARSIQRWMKQHQHATGALDAAKDISSRPKCLSEEEMYVNIAPGEEWGDTWNRIHKDSSEYIRRLEEYNDLWTQLRTYKLAQQYSPDIVEDDGDVRGGVHAPRHRTRRVKIFRQWGQPETKTVLEEDPKITREDITHILAPGQQGYQDLQAAQLADWDLKIIHEYISTSTLPDNALDRHITKESG